MNSVVTDHTESEARLHRIFYFVKYLRAMVLNLTLVLAALALYAFGGIGGIYFLADETIAALKAQAVLAERNGEPNGAAFVTSTAVFSGLATMVLFLWMYLAITNVWPRSLRILAIFMLFSALFVPFWGWPQLAYAMEHLDPLFAALVAASFVIMILIVVDVTVGLWRVAGSPERASFIATLDPRLTRNAWSYVNKLLDLPRTPWLGWRNVLAYLLAFTGAIVAVAALITILGVGNVASKLSILMAGCPSVSEAECRAQSAAWAYQCIGWTGAAFAALFASGALQSAAKWLGGLSVLAALGASGGRFILYLRPFDTDDDTLPRPKLPFLSRLVALRPFPIRVEEELFDVADGHLPLIAIGNPADSGNSGGGIAHRAYLADGDWQSYVADKIRSADSIVVLLKNTDGVRWEIERVLGDSVEEKTLFLFDPAAKDPVIWDRLVTDMLRPFIERGYLPAEFKFQGRPIGFYFRGSSVVEVQNANWSATSYRTLFSEFLAERVGAG